MKLVIAGSRTFNEYDIVEMIEPLFKFFGIQKEKVKEIVSGGANGVDSGAELYCELHFEEATFTKMEADWSKHGKKAGPIRNAQMAEYADELLLIWDGESAGSKNMKLQMQAKGKPIHEVIVRSI